MDDYKAQLSTIYDEMVERNRLAILENGITFDPLLIADHLDTRTCLAAYTFRHFKLTDHFHNMMKV
jgi:hypothetical protein